MNLEIKALSESLVPEFLSFFETTAFADNPDWSGCYCQFFYIPDDEVWKKRTGYQNQRDTITRIREDKMHGFLAFHNNIPIGFCNADMKSAYPRILAMDEIREYSRPGTAAIVCFIIAGEFRRQGVATRLLDAVCGHYGSTECDVLEAYPRKHAASPAEHYYGPLEMYTKAGFEVIKEYEHFYLVQRECS
jgi:ribosomal protein S18 acetylase RimI-like enzyme